ncbi:MAG: GreA/GreB family elongation factor [Planctomycetota bacterium]
MEHRLVELARAGQMDALEEAWLESMEVPEAIDDYLDALAALPAEASADTKRALLGLLAESLEKANRSQEAARALVALVDAGEATSSVRTRLLKQLRAIYGKERWCEAILDESGVTGGLELQPAVQRLEALLRLQPGRAVEHRGGWGIGVIRAIDERVREVRVEFMDGRRVDLPFASAVDIFDVLPADDYRSLRHTNLEGLKERAREDPAFVVHALAKAHRGRITAAELKKELCGLVIAESAWASWWKGAKQAAARHPCLAVEGGARPVYYVREGPVSPEEAARSAVAGAADLASALVETRNLLAADPDPATVAAALDALAAQVCGAETTDTDAIEARLLLHSRQHRAGDATELLRIVERGGAKGLATLLQDLATADARRLAVTVLANLRPTDAVSILKDVVLCLQSDVVDGVIEFLTQRKAPGLVELLERLLPQPSRTPYATFHLGRRLVAGRLPPLQPGEVPENLVRDVTVAFLQLYESQSLPGERGDAAARSLVRRLESHLTDKRLRLLSRFTESASRDAVQQVLVMARASRHFTDAMNEALTEGASLRFPDLVSSRSAFFWESDFIFTTKKGLERKREEFRVLTQEKIPENSRAIGQALGHGDLSENAEWEAALEEQRQLTHKASEMEAELKRWRAIEDQEIPHGVVAPGCRVTYVAGGQTSALTILGPWDTGADGVISYLAPLARAFLGHRSGDHVRAKLPSGEMDLVVHHVEKVV